MTKSTTIISRPLNIKAMKSVLKDMKRDGVVKVPPYSKLCNKCLRNLFNRLQKSEAKRIANMIISSAPPSDDK